MEAGTVAPGGESTEQQVAAPAATEQTQQGAGGQGGTPDLAEQYADLKARLEKVEGGGGQEQAQAVQSETDLFASLFGGQSAQAQQQQGSEEELTQEDIAALQAAGIDLSAFGIDAGQGAQQQQQPQADPRIDELQQQISQMGEREYAREMKAIQEQYPDITKPEVLDVLKERLTNFAQQYGDKIARDPSVVRTVYQAIKAEQADAKEGTAEQVVDQGASLETNAGRSQQGGTDPSEEYADKLIAANGGGNAFTK